MGWLLLLWKMFGGADVSVPPTDVALFETQILTSQTFESEVQTVASRQTQVLTTALFETEL